jgi:catechol 2,3-dioxygenase-like lactoylglutathione lyase family enzyme
MVDDVERTIEFYTTNFGFELGRDTRPSFEEVIRGNLRLLLAGPDSSAGWPMPDGRKPEPGGWNRIHFVVEDIGRDVQRLRDVGCAVP